MRGDGDGWMCVPGGGKRWGRYGAAGLLLRAPSESGPALLLQHRAAWSHHGGTWGLPGGARDSHESTAETALREAAEEAGVRAVDVAVRAERLTAPVPPGWGYTVVVADARRQLDTQPNRESAELRWVPEQNVAALDLHPGFAASWPALRARPVRLYLDHDDPDLSAFLGPGLNSLFPLTFALPDGEFAWVRRPENDFVPDRVPHGGGCVVVTGDRALRDRLAPAVYTVEPSALFSGPG